MRLLRMLGIGLAMLVAVGFGLCGAFGLVAGVSMVFHHQIALGDVGLFVGCGLAGLAIAAGLVRLALDLLRPKQ